ncbi:ATP-binding cassette domain-containing protein [Heliobacterium undosum]|uniref:ATP-binding cassette domain-containing protein n=1 Tax=Heliomicrobium undosum TaxID=121734 RepID=A0A845L7E3_9FIRM|nr:ATP-binding cassette domain-containing protein [Heliomicrobium undosum]MZP31199.1 ATP-binding cassette domain-containing protein [Heliomicrobium undosum]
MKAIIEAKNLVKRYGDFTAVNGVSFCIREGECFGFLGPNGAGKSTTMRMLYGLSRVDAGELILMGEKVTLTPPSLKAHLGIVPQEDNLDPDLTVRENLLVHASFYGISATQAAARTEELLNFMALEEKADADVESLSGGLKRRLVIARALVNDPKIVVLDEPTTGLDPAARHLVWQKLRQLKERGITLLLTTHYMEEASQLCDRLVIISEGRILAEGAPDWLVQTFIPPEVIQVNIPASALPEGLAAEAERLGAHPVIHSEMTFLFTDEGDRLWEQIPALGLNPRRCIHRPSNLEDVYLTLTGGSLGHDD